MKAGFECDLKLQDTKIFFSYTCFQSAQKYLSFNLIEVDILRELTMHMPVQPLEHRRSFP